MKTVKLGKSLNERKQVAQDISNCYYRGDTRQ